MDADDRVQIHELPGRYGNAIDDRDWERLDQVFTDDAVFDMRDIGLGTHRGLKAIRQFMSGYMDHPLTHLMLNIYVDETPNGVELQARVIATLPGGGVRTASCYDVVVSTSVGWRISRRVVFRGRRPTVASPSGPPR